MKSETTYIGLIAAILVAGVLLLAISIVNIDPDNPIVIGGGDEPVELKTFSSMNEIQEFFEENSAIGYYGGGILAESGTFAVPSIANAAGKAQQSDSSSRAGDYSETNIQVQGVDEPDIVKNDGKYIYAVSGNSVVIVNAFPAESMRILSEVKVENSVSNIFINGDKLIVFSSENEYINTGARCAGVPSFGLRCGSYSKTTTHIDVYDTNDKENPELIQEVELDGWYVDARMIGDYVYVVSSSSVSFNNFDLPTYRVNGALTEAIPSDVGYFPGSDSSYTFNSILALNLESEEVSREVYLMGASRTIFVSKENIYFTHMKQISQNTYLDEYAEVVVLPLLPNEEKEKVREIVEGDDSYYVKRQKIDNVFLDYAKTIPLSETPTQLLLDYAKARENFDIMIQKETEKTIIHKVNIEGNRIKYRGSGEVPGRILNQFSMDEFDGYFRIATTTGFVSRSGRANSLNHLYVLDEDMEIVGSVEDLAPGERIYSVRFLGNRAYMVTFKKVDPLFVIDLSDPEDPEVLGYLKITGFSDYLHPYDENHIIGIGKETAGGNEDFSWYQGVKISLFDVTDVNNPVERAKIEIGDRGTDSFALRDHKAFLFDRERNLLVVPIALSEIDESKYAGEIPDNTFGERVWQGAFVLDISLNGIEERGRITHYDFGDTLNRWYYGGQKAIQRSLYMDDVLYTISGSKIKANDLESVEFINSVDFSIETNDYPKPGYEF